MTNVREYRIPLMIGGGALVVALLIWAVIVSPQNSKLSSLQAQETQLQTQQTALQVKLSSLKSEQQKLSSSCTDLQKIATQIPSVQSPTDIAAEESSFESQFNGLTAGSGVTLTQFSGFAPATTATATPTPTTGSAAAGAKAGVVAVPTTLAVTGNYSQIHNFINDLDGFPRLFVIQTFNLTYGATAASTASGTTGSSSSGSSSSAGAAAPSAAQPPLWVGGTATSSSAGPYSLAIVGSIYYTSTPSALDACTKATAAVH
jgi:Tfp pilus assembly protein PilO